MVFIPIRKPTFGLIDAAIFSQSSSFFLFFSFLTVPRVKCRSAVSPFTSNRYCCKGGEFVGAASRVLISTGSSDSAESAIGTVPLPRSPNSDARPNDQPIATQRSAVQCSSEQQEEQ